MDKDTFLKRYEKVAFFRFFGLFFASFLLMFLLLVSFYYHIKSSDLAADVQVEMDMKKASCNNISIMAQEMNLSNIEDCKQYTYKYELVDLSSLYEELLYSLLVLLLFVPISLYLAFFSLKPIHQASSMIDNFIANIVHDINTPIATINLNVKSLLKKSQEAPKKLQRILSSAKQLTDMQHDLLALADENKEINQEPVNLKELSQDILSGFQLQYPNQVFEEHIHEQLITVNLVDLRRILQNLISNAVKYNRDNNPITLSSSEKSLIIEDHGKGIANPEKIFEKNYREDYSIQGNGLGLASVLAMLDRNNITIMVSSELNKGTKIILNFR